MSTEEFVITNDLKHRQICAVLIQDLGILHNVSQSLINTAIVYMHKLYENFSYKDLKPVYVAMTSFYLASKSEDCARKLNEIVKSVYQLAGKQIDTQFDRVVAAVHALESIMLMSVGFPKLDFKHPHVLILHLTKSYEMNIAFYETAYYLCTAILHLTTIVTRYTTEDIAAASIYIACKWDFLDLKDIDNIAWYKRINPSINLSVIQKISKEFLEIYVKTPTKLKIKAAQFLKRFNNKTEPTVHNSTVISSTNKPSGISSTIKQQPMSDYLAKYEKEDPLEEGEIDNANNSMSTDKIRSSSYNPNKKLSLNQYYQRKEDGVTKLSPSIKLGDVPKSFSQSDLQNSSDKYHNSQGNNVATLKRRYENQTNPSISNHNQPQHHQNFSTNYNQHHNRSGSNKHTKLDASSITSVPASSQGSSNNHSNNNPHVYSSQHQSHYQQKKKYSQDASFNNRSSAQHFNNNNS